MMTSRKGKKIQIARMTGTTGPLAKFSRTFKTVVSTLTRKGKDLNKINLGMERRVVLMTMERMIRMSSPEETAS